MTREEERRQWRGQSILIGRRQQVIALRQTDSSADFGASLLEGETKMRFPPRQWCETSVWILLVCLTVLSCASTAMSQAQSNAADLQGIVRDPNGAVVANASVTARNVGTNVTREATTNNDGFYKIVNLPPGEYEVTVK